MQYDEHKLVEYFADAPAGVGFSDLDLNNIPHHISCIMDGNGRWSTARGLARTEGHKAGIVSLREIITACVRLGVDVLSAYAFSTENWNRPQHEVNVLMHLFAKTFIDELPLLKRENVRVVFLGDISALPKKTRDVFERGLAESPETMARIMTVIAFVRPGDLYGQPIDINVPEYGMKLLNLQLEDAVDTAATVESNY